ncbi:MAG: hypothetical protein K6G22_02245 [Lachnospiraceae bacterium]|nr:hypothetical protein [Lachnospiraceae bacterium]
MKKRTVISLIAVTAMLTMTACAGNYDNIAVPSDMGLLDEVNKDNKEDSTSDEETKKAKKEDVKEEISQTDTEPETEKVDLFTLLMDESGCTGDEIMLFDQDDFDGDGTDEAFALIGEPQDDFEDFSAVVGEIWFAGADGCEMLHDSNAGMGFASEERKMTIGGVTYVMFDEEYATGRLTDIWYVAEGKPVIADFSTIGYVYEDPVEENRFRMVDSSYDAVYDIENEIYLGHTWKTYYFFYNSETDEICEYAGTNIDSETAEYLCGFDPVSELVPKGDEPLSLFCRGTGDIVLNYSHTEDDMVEYYHYIYNFLDKWYISDDGEVIDAEPQSGIYLEALCPDMANYPEVPTPY